ncbi:NUDIX hydrolase domain-like protein [Chytriomyces cf. hyalinus JEL632]|nr:NUDIX hydrolase domain-like protein [Chytriomyces cf. hyalinus JEL632]
MSIETNETLFEQCVEAIARQDFETANDMISRNAQLAMHVNSKNWSLLHFVCRYSGSAGDGKSAQETVRRLVAAGSRTDARTSEGRSVVEMATQWGSQHLLDGVLTNPTHSTAALSTSQIITEPSVYFGASSLNFSRVSDKREDPAALSQLLRNPDALFLPMPMGSDSSVLLTQSGDALRWLSHKDLEACQLDVFRILNEPCSTDPTLILLGVLDNKPKWALDVSECQTVLDYIQNTLALSFKKPRPAAYALTAVKEESNIYAQARSILDWHARYKFCSLCGSATVAANGGYKRKCSSAKEQCKSHGSVQNSCFPRTDPVAIICIVSADGDRVLLGRQKAWPPGMYSCIAGFMEPGETIESACRREAKEETNVTIGARVQYFSSQPWPFPANLMVGMFGQTVVGGEDISLVDNELEDAKWFTREEVMAAVGSSNASAGPTTLKTAAPYAIAYQLLKHWVDGDFKWNDNQGKTISSSKM